MMKIEEGYSWGRRHWLGPGFRGIVAAHREEVGKHVREHCAFPPRAMKLYVTPGSPYARMARIVVLEKGLQDRVEAVTAKTRTPGSPYYAINPTGRVPYLVCGDGTGLEESALICDYLDQVDGKPVFGLPGDGHKWEARRLEALARSLLDGLSVWLREILRPAGEQSPTTIAHERDRAARILDLWEAQADHPYLQGPLNLIQLTLACALGIEARNPGFQWRPGRPKLVAWYECLAARPSFAATAPPGAAPAAKPQDSSQGRAA